MINQSLQKVIYNEQNANSIWSIYEQNRKKMQKDVGDRFKKLRQVVKKPAREPMIMAGQGLGNTLELEAQAIPP